MSGRREVGAADHQRPPDEGRTALRQPTQTLLYGGRRLTDAHEQSDQGEGRDGPTTRLGQVEEQPEHEQDRERNREDHPRPRDQTGEDGMGGEVDAPVARGVETGLHVEVVADEVVGRMRQHEAEQCQREVSPMCVRVSRRENPTDRSRDHGHRYHTRARDQEPARHGVHHAVG